MLQDVLDVLVSRSYDINNFNFISQIMRFWLEAPKWLSQCIVLKTMFCRIRTPNSFLKPKPFF